MQHDWASFRFQLVRATATHEWSLRTLGEFIGLQFGLVGFILLPVVLTGVALTAWRGYRRGDAVAILLSTAVIVPFVYFLWKSLSLRVGDTWPMFIWPFGFAAAAINLRDAAARRLAGHRSSDRRSSGRGWRSSPASSSSSPCLFYYVAHPSNFIGRTDPVGGEAGYRAVVRRAEVELQKTGATWIATTDYRTYAMLRWFFRRPRAGGPDQRARAVSRLSRARHGLDPGHTGLYVGREPDNDPANPLWASTTAIREPLERVDRVWRGMRDGHLRAGEVHRLDAGALAAAGFAAVSLARAGGRCRRCRSHCGLAAIRSCEAR